MPFIAELASAKGYKSAHEVARLAKEIGPTVPEAAYLGKSLLGSRATSIIEAALPPATAPLADDRPGGHQVEGVTPFTPSRTDLISEPDSDLQSSAEDPSSASPFGSPPIGKILVIAFIALWVWWLAQQLTDLDQNNVSFLKYDTTEKVDFFVDSLDFPEKILGPGGMIYWLGSRRRRASDDPTARPSDTPDD